MNSQTLIKQAQETRVKHEINWNCVHFLTLFD